MSFLNVDQLSESVSYLILLVGFIVVLAFLLTSVGYTATHAKARSGQRGHEKHFNACPDHGYQGEEGNLKEGSNPVPSVWPLCSGTGGWMEAGWISTVCTTKAPDGSCDLSRNQFVALTCNHMFSTHVGALQPHNTC